MNRSMHSIDLLLLDIGIKSRTLERDVKLNKHNRKHINLLLENVSFLKIDPWMSTPRLPRFLGLSFQEYTKMTL